MKRISLIASLAATLFVLGSGSAQAHGRDQHASVGLSLHFPQASLQLNNRQHYPQPRHNRRGHQHRYAPYGGGYGYNNLHQRRQSYRQDHHERMHYNCRNNAPNPRRCMARIHGGGHGHQHGRR